MLPGQWRQAVRKRYISAMESAGIKIFFAGLLIAVALMTAFRPNAGEPARADATVITLSFWGSYEEWEMWREIIALFHAKNPDVFVKTTYIPSQYDDKIRLLLAADSAPDLMLIQDEPYPAYAGYGKFADLTDLAYAAECPVKWDADFWPTAAESFKYKGRVMGVPIWGGNCLIYYNRQMFREMGVPFPDDDWTFDEFVATAKALTRDKNGDGRFETFGFSLPTWIYFLPWTWGFGADYLNGPRTDWAFDGPAAIASARFYQDLRFGFRICPSIQDMPAASEGAFFMTGKVGMLCSGPWGCPGLITANIDFDVVHMPMGPVGERYTRVSWDALCMFDQCRNKDAAWRFMLHCLTDDAQAVIGRYLRSIPAIARARDAFENPDNGWQEEKFIEALSYSRIQPISKKWDAMNNVLLPEYELLSLNKITPEEAVKRMGENIRKEKVFPIEDRE